MTANIIDIVKATPAAIEAVTHFLNGNRSVIIEVDNNTDFPLTVFNTTLQHGGFADLPNAQIPAQAADVFGAQSSANSLWTGTEGSVVYQSNQFQLVIHWDNPYAGGNSCSAFILGPNAMLFDVKAFAGAGNEKAHMRFVVSPSNKDFKMINFHSGKHLDIPDAALADGVIVQQYTENNGDNQLWSLLPTPGGYYSIVNKHSQKVLDVPNGSNVDQVKIQQYENHHGQNQQWRLLPVAGGFFPMGGSLYEIINRQSRKVLDIPNGQVKDGIQVQQYTENGGDNQKWKLTPIGWSPLSTSMS